MHLNRLIDPNGTNHLLSTEPQIPKTYYNCSLVLYRPVKRC